MKISEVFVVLIAASWLTGCASTQPRAYAVGTYIGGGSVVVGPSKCTYDAPASVADHVGQGPVKLIGEGKVTETCGTSKESIDVLRATALRIDGPEHVKAGATPGPEDDFRVTALAGSRQLDGISSGSVTPEWSLGEDCPADTKFGPVLGSQDTGGPAVTRSIIASKPGPCTLKATVLDLSTSRTIRID